MKNMMSVVLVIGAITLSHLAVAMASTHIQVASVADNMPRYATHAPIFFSLDTYKFQVNQDRDRARLVVDYNFTPAYEDLPPLPSSNVELPGLVYDAAASAVLYRDGEKVTKCATVQEKTGLFGKYLKVKNTGLCRVTAKTIEHRNDGGWSKGYYHSLDVFFDVP